MVHFHTFFCLPHCFFLLGSPGFLQRIRLNRQIEKEIAFVFIFQRTVVFNKGNYPGGSSCLGKQQQSLDDSQVLSAQTRTRWFYKYVNRKCLLPPDYLAAGAKSSRRNTKNSPNIEKVRNSLSDPVNNLMIYGQDTPLSSSWMPEVCPN